MIVSAKELAWHYTTLDSLQLILESGNLLATEVSYQNDPLEPKTGQEVVAKALAFLRSDEEFGSFATRAHAWLDQYNSANGFIFGSTGELIEPSRFIFCASTDGDNLYAWRTYAANSRNGCAIGLDVGAPLGVIRPGKDEPAVESGRWRRVIYQEDELLKFAIDQLREAGRMWNKDKDEDERYAAEQLAAGAEPHEVEWERFSFYVLIHHLPQAIDEITAVAKHSSYRDEQEIRVTMSNASSGVMFTPGANGPRPRVRLASANTWGERLDSATKLLPIRAVMLAPNASTEAETTIRWLLYAYGYPLDPVEVIDESGPTPLMYQEPSSEVAIGRSRHPFRTV